MQLFSIFGNFGSDFIYSFFEFLYAPFIYIQMLYILVPFFLAILLMDFYFKKYPREGIGHHRALENAIFLLFICADLIRLALENSIPVKIFLCFVFLIFSVVVIVMDFMHMLPTNVIGKASSKFLIAYSSYIMLVLSYSKMLESTSFSQYISIIGAVLVLLLILIIIRSMFSFLEPKSYAEIEVFLNRIDRDIKRTDSANLLLDSEMEIKKDGSQHHKKEKMQQKKSLKEKIIKLS